MITEWTSIISDGLCLDDCVDHEALNRYTTRHHLTDIGRIEWQNTRELYVLGADASAVRFGGVDAGCYTDETTSWVLVVGAGAGQIDTIINRCGIRLKLLDMRFLDLKKLSLHDRLSNLESLRLSPMEQLQEVEGLSNLIRLTELDLSFTAIGTHFDVMDIPKLKRLDMVGNSELSHIDGLSGLTELEELDLSGTSIGKELDLSGFQKLKRLRLVDTPKLKSVFGLGNNPELTHVDLSCSGVRRIPDDTKDLKKLIHLDLSYLNLEELPDWLPKLGMNFTYCEDGINLRGAHAPGLYLEKLSVKTTEKDFQAHQAWIRQWFEDQKKEIARPLNELRVIFLGDGGAGKSHIISRLLRDGEKLDVSDGVATSGIDVSNKSYQIGDRNVRVHFWDFGCLEILHSMYRLFMTQRTLYVVVVNVRDGDPDASARYWMHNIQSFAKDSPVLLVLNQIDTNPNASVNENDLRMICPNLKEIVKVSALFDSKEAFDKNVVSSIKRQIGELPHVDTLFPPAWSRLKDILRNKTAPYIREEEYLALCDKNGIEKDLGIRTGLLKWFDDLGIITRIGDEFNDYMVLNPNWIAAGISKILMSGHDLSRNGSVSRREMLHLLQSENQQKGNSTYTEADANCILDFMKRYQLAFDMNEETMFIPILGDAQVMAVAAEYADDAATVEFRMEYEYLPSNVIHRLMVQRYMDLDTNNIWHSGARFVLDDAGLSAVVMSEENVLRMFVRSERTTDIAQTYVDILMKELQTINESMGLTVRRKEIAYKAGGKVEYFDYDDLLLAQGLDETHVLSKVHRMRIPIPAILMQVHYVETDRQQRLVQDMLWSCTMLQNNRIFAHARQDDRNVFVRDLLRAKGYFVSDNTFTGVSRTGKQMGELDLDIRTEPGIPWTMCETMNIASSGNSSLQYWNSKLGQLLTDYNPHGLPFMFLVGYVQCPRYKFSKIMQHYYQHMQGYAPRDLPVLDAKMIQGTAETSEGNQYIRLFRAVYDTGDHPTTVYHIFVHLDKEDSINPG